MIGISEHAWNVTQERLGPQIAAAGELHLDRSFYGRLAEAIRAAADLGDQGMEFTAYEMAVLATIAYHQPISRAELKEVLGKDINRDLIGRLFAKELISTGPRSPKRGPMSRRKGSCWRSICRV